MKQNFIKKEVAEIESVFGSVLRAKGLPSVFYGEKVLFRELPGLVLGFDQNLIEILIFGDISGIRRYERILKTNEIFKLPVGKNFLGRVINSLGEPIDGKGEIQIEEFRPIFIKAPQVLEREPVETSLETGIKAIDALLPIGRGQRELILGDRKLGKSTLAIDTVIHQSKKRFARPVFSIYCLVGHEEGKTLDLIHILEKEGALENVIIVSSSSSTPAGMQYLAPFLATCLGEYFRDRGEDALVIYDDLTRHAWAWREINLILARPPGREAYPGDIFSLHASLLERSAKLSFQKGGGSLTALPIVETEEGDITAFIPTDLISITDGQIFVERDLFQAGQKPAVNIGLSVSRVGSQAQPQAFKGLLGDLRITLSQYRELQKLTKLERRFAKESEITLKRGALLTKILNQEKHKTIPAEKQVIVFYAIIHGFLDKVEPKDLLKIEAKFLDYLDTLPSEKLENILAKDIKDEIKDEVEKIIKDFLAQI